ncbi:HAD family phosphatase [Streptomyces sp. NPDC000987]|uniref:HAD family hydrolase n=1 Tax=Streptomyces sp. NPDC000987 TaxID=3154374 RepID=UPI00331A5E6B
MNAASARAKPQTSAVLFDLGGVLIDWNPRHLYRGLFGDDRDGMEEFLATVCTPAWNLEQDRGRPFSEGIALLCRRFPQHREMITAFRERWEEMVAGDIPDNVALLRRITDAGRGVFAITDWSAETFPLVRRRFPFLDLFDGIVVSGEEGFLKPSAEIFGVARTRFGLDPATTTFVDDSRENYHGARRLGYDAIHYKNPGQLREELAARGWPVGGPDDG